MRSIKKFFKKTFRYDLDRALFIACCMLVCLMIYGILATVFPHYDIGGKKPLEGEYETVQYLHDDEYFLKPRRLNSRPRVFEGKD